MSYNVRQFFHVVTKLNAFFKVFGYIFSKFFVVWFFGQYSILRHILQLVFQLQIIVVDLEEKIMIDDHVCADDWNEIVNAEGKELLMRKIDADDTVNIGLLFNAIFFDGGEDHRLIPFGGEH